MANPMYDITFSVDRAGLSVTPTAPQRAGYYGDDGFAVVRFVLANAADAAAHQFRIEIVDGNGAYDVTELLTLQNGAITYTVPAAWTAAGLATIRLVEIEIGDDGTETAVLHYPPAQLFFEAREDGTAMGEMLPTWQRVMTEAETAAAQAMTATEQAAIAANNADAVTTQAAIAANNAEAAATKAVAAANNADAATTRATVAANNAQFSANNAEKATAAAEEAAMAATAASDEMRQTVGDIEAALDRIIAIQESLIGGDV